MARQYSFLKHKLVTHFLLSLFAGFPSMKLSEDLPIRLNDLLGELQVVISYGTFSSEGNFLHNFQQNGRELSFACEMPALSPIFITKPLWLRHGHDLLEKELCLSLADLYRVVDTGKGPYLRRIAMHHLIDMELQACDAASPLLEGTPPYRWLATE